MTSVLSLSSVLDAFRIRDCSLREGKAKNRAPSNARPHPKRLERPGAKKPGYCIPRVEERCGSPASFRELTTLIRRRTVLAYVRASLFRRHPLLLWPSIMVVVHAAWEPDWLAARGWQWLLPFVVSPGAVHPGSFRCPYYLRITRPDRFVEQDQPARIHPLLQRNFHGSAISGGCRGP